MKLCPVVPRPSGLLGAPRGWWIAILFIVGSSLFGLGAVPPYADAVGLRASALTFFIGSLFFTACSVPAVPRGGRWTPRPPRHSAPSVLGVGTA